jgi:hypothetical protein
MSRKILVVIWVLILAGFVLTGAARAGELDGSLAALHVPKGEDSIGPAQLKIATPTSQPVNADATVNPVRSEAGRDIGLVLGATILVLIVIGGVIFSLRHCPAPKAKD